MNQTKTCLTLLITSLLVACGSSQTSEKVNTSEKEMKKVVNITEIIGKNSEQVSEIFGPVGSVEKVKPSGTPCKENPCDKGIYQSGKYEIVFIDGKADWITINDMSDYALDEKSINLLGLPQAAPTFSNPSTVLRWDDYEGMREISFFNDGSDMIDYIYVKAKTK